MIYGEVSPAAIMLSTLHRNSKLSGYDQQAILGLEFTPQICPPRRLIYREESDISGPFVVLDGHVLCYKNTASGARQIVAIYRKGDIVGVQSLMNPRLDYDIAAATRATIAWVPSDDFQKVCSTSSNIVRALIAIANLEASIAREWLVNNAVRSAESRIAHFIAEHFAREEMAGMTVDATSHLPFTQLQIGDATAVTPVHVNRMLRNLKDRGAISANGHTYTVADREILELIGDFEDAYLRIRVRSDSNPDH